MGNLDIYEKYRSVPKEAQKEIIGGRMRGKTDINPMWRIKCLTEQFGICGIGWYYNTTKKWIDIYETEGAAFVDIELFVKVDGEWSKPISGTGGSRFFTQEDKKVYVSDECYKMATTDAISVACKQLGFGADIYWSGDSTKYDSKPSEQKQQNTSNTAKQAESPSEHDKLVAEFISEMKRTGKTYKSTADASEPKYIKSDKLVKFIAGLKALPDVSL